MTSIAHAIECDGINDACREAFPDTLRILNNIVENMHRGGAPSEWDLNNVLLRFAMDMTSIVVSAPITAKAGWPDLTCRTSQLRLANLDRQCPAGIPACYDLPKQLPRRMAYRELYWGPLPARGDHISP